MPTDPATSTDGPVATGEGIAKKCKLKLHVPLYPRCSPEDAGPRETVRIGQAESLDLAFVWEAISPNVVFGTEIAGRQWVLSPVLSGYSNAFHAMLVPAGYVPAPEWVLDDEGDEVLLLAASVLAEAERQSGGGTVCIGYNWSPLGFGELEGKSGLQSIPTKFHPHIWAWWPFPDPGGIMQHNLFRAEWVQC
jgi:hypothetical protein